MSVETLQGGCGETVRERKGEGERIQETGDQIKGA